MSRFHGVFSLMLLFISVAAGFIAVSSASILLAGVYAAITVLSSTGIIWFYCSKCTCREYACGHGLPGKLTRFFPARESGKYSAVDIMATGIAMATIIGFPQYWLWKYKPLFAIFWILVVIAIAEILLCVCSGCENTHCPICKNPIRDEPC